MSEIKPRLTNGEAWALARENRKRVDDVMQAEVERDAQGCEYESLFDQVRGQVRDLKAALEEAQAEGEFYASEAEALRVEVGHLKDSHASRDAELESAESALEEAREKLKAVRVECDLWPDCSQIGRAHV